MSVATQTVIHILTTVRARRVEHERSVGKAVFYCFLSALLQNRTQSRLLYMFHDKEYNNFQRIRLNFQTDFFFQLSKQATVASAVHCFLIKHAKTSQSQPLLI